MRMMKIMIRNIKYGIENLIKWFPIVVRDRDWDFYFLLAIMKFKIQNMQDAADVYWISGSADKMADDMETVVNLLEYFMGDEGWVNDRDKYTDNKKELMDLLSNFDHWWD